LGIALAAADLTGTWQLHLDPDFGGVDDTIVCTFAQDGRTLTIRCGSGFPLVGAVDGDKVTFEAKTGTHNEFTAVFTAVRDPQATTMKGPGISTGESCATANSTRGGNNEIENQAARISNRSVGCFVVMGGIRSSR